MADLTPEQARDALARERLELKWVEVNYEAQQKYNEIRRTKELRMLELQERATAPIDLTSDGENDRVTVKSETTEREPLQADHFGAATEKPESSGGCYPTPSRSMQSVASKDKTHHLDTSSSGEASTWKAVKNFTAPDPTNLPTIIDDPNGIRGVDYIELRCMKCGANGGRDRRFFKGAKGFYHHIIFGHKNDFSDSEVPSLANIISFCFHQKLGHKEIQALKRGRKMIDCIPARPVRGSGKRPTMQRAPLLKSFSGSKPKRNPTPVPGQSHPSSRPKKEEMSDRAGLEVPELFHSQLSYQRNSLPPTAPQSLSGYDTGASQLPGHFHGLGGMTRGAATAEAGMPIQGATTEAKAFPEKTQSVHSESIFPTLGSGSASPTLDPTPPTSKND